MYSLYDEEKSFIEQINYVKTLYESQKIKVKNEQYIEDLLLQDYIRTIRKNTSRYDYIINIFTIKCVFCLLIQHFRF